MRVVLVLAAALLTRGQAAPPPAPAAASSLPNTVWERTYRSGTSEYELRFTAPAGDALWIVVGVRPKGQLGGDQQQQLWHLDAKGERTSTTDLEQKTVYGVAALPNGSAAVVADGDRGGITYVVADASGQLVSKRAVATHRSDVHVTSVRAANGNVIATGRFRLPGWILKLRPSGDVIDDLVIADVSIVEDAFETPDGYVAVGSSVKGAAAAVWVGRLNTKGEVGATATFTGVKPRLGVDGRRAGYVLVYETNAQQGRNIVVQRLSDALASESSTTWPETMRGMTFGPYGIEPIGDADVLIAAESPATLPWLRRVNRSGQPVWSYEYRDPAAAATRMWNASLARWNRDYLAAFTVTVVEPIGDTYEQRQIVKLIRFGG